MMHGQTKIKRYFKFRKILTLNKKYKPFPLGKMVFYGFLPLTIFFNGK